MSLNTFVLIFPTECERLRGLGVYIHQYLCWSSQLNGKFYAGGNLNSSIPVLVFPLECKFYGSESLYSSIPVLIFALHCEVLGVCIPQYLCWSSQLNVNFSRGGSLYSSIPLLICPTECEVLWGWEFIFREVQCDVFRGWEFRFLNIVVECCWSSQLNVEFNCCPWSWAGCVLV